MSDSLDDMVVLRRHADGTPAVWCDPDIADVVGALNNGGVPTRASCSGHGKRPGNVALADGRELIVAADWHEARKVEAAFPPFTNPDDDRHQFEPVDAPDLFDPHTCRRCGEGRSHPSHVDLDCCRANRPVAGGFHQEGEKWTCPTCGNAWIHVIEESEGCWWEPEPSHAEDDGSGACPGPAPPQTAHWGASPNCSECGHEADSRQRAIEAAAAGIPTQYVSSDRMRRKIAEGCIDDALASGGVAVR